MQIYIHIPFCLSKCKYCAFNSIVANYDLIEDYIKALCSEIGRTRLNQEISTIYIGGGTPSILTIEQFNKIFDVLNRVFNLDRCNEITIEANPGTNLTYSYLNELQRIGINRLSLGVQSFDDETLKIIGRVHNSNEAIEAIILAKSIFSNVSIDLMYDLPNQTLNILHETLTTALNLNVQHISIYGLEIEEGTEFDRLNGLGQLNLPDDDESAEMYAFITSELPKHGYHRYEISNFSKKGFESKHNIGYWSDVEYVGFGVSAHSYLHDMRYSNIANVKEYIDKINANLEVKQIEEVVTKKRAMEEFCFLSLRKAEGIDTKKFQIKFGESIENIYNNSIKKLTEQGLIIVDGEHIKLTERGMKYGNIAFAEFLLTDD